MVLLDVELFALVVALPIAIEELNAIDDFDNVRILNKILLLVKEQIKDLEMEQQSQ